MKPKKYFAIMENYTIPISSATSLLTIANKLGHTVMKKENSY